MRDVSRKYNTFRTARASAALKAAPETIQMIREGKVPKGDPLALSKVAAVQAAKETSRIIPYCHPVPVDFVGVDFKLGAGRIDVEVEVKAIYKTGVEMEALTGASVAALNLYDMLKMVDESLEILNVKLLEKKGGKSDFRDTYKKPVRAGVLVFSDSASSGRWMDESGILIRDRLKEEGVEVEEYRIVSDDREEIIQSLKEFADELALDLVVTTGGTGFGPRDNAPEAMEQVIERGIQGINEAMRAHGQDRTPFAMLSRGKAGMRGKTLILNLPGSSKGAAESLDAVFPGLLHAFKMIRGLGHKEDGLGADL